MPADALMNLRPDRGPVLFDHDKVAGTPPTHSGQHGGLPGFSGGALFLLLVRRVRGLGRRSHFGSVTLNLVDSGGDMSTILYVYGFASDGSSQKVAAL